MPNLNKSRVHKKYENTKVNELKHDIMVFHAIYRIIIIMLLVLLGFTFYNLNYKNEEITRLIENQVIEYQTDSWDGRYSYIGYIINKTKDGDNYTLQVVGYGNFNVSEVEYYEVELGKKLPQVIMNRGAN